MLLACPVSRVPRIYFLFVLKIGFLCCFRACGVQNLYKWVNFIVFSPAEGGGKHKIKVNAGDAARSHKNIAIWINLCYNKRIRRERVIQLYPLTFDPIYKEMVWGGSQLADLFGRTLPSPHTGESWDVSCRPDEMSVVSNGTDKGKTLEAVIRQDPEGVLGKRMAGRETFGLLIKLISANDNLSVQVHPDDSYARRVEQKPFGKTEMWIVLDAPKDAYLIVGLKDGVTQDVFRRAIETGEVEDCLEKVPAKPGDVFYIPAGLIHALTSGIVVAEVQQNSDLTYRVFDYNRVGLDGKPRPLHVEKAIDVSDFTGALSKEPVVGVVTEQDGNTWVDYTSSELFALWKVDVKERLTEQSDPDRYFIYTCLEGSCEVRGGTDSIRIGKGDSCFIPAALGTFKIEGACVLLKTYMQG